MSAKKVLMSGNEAIAEGAIRAGCRFYAGYPITPQNELIGYMSRHMPEARGVFIQAESEIAAINMVFGAAAAGARAMTSSSSPGISLKQEGISYLAAAQLPSLIVNVMRGGPGLGNIAPAQSDYFQATKGGGHGDYHMIVLAPYTVQEAYECPAEAFDLADLYRIPVMILIDGILGQMMEPVNAECRGQIAEGRSRNAQRRPIPKLWALTGCKGRRANVVKSFYMKEGDLEKFNLSLQAKYKLIRAKEQRFEVFAIDDAEKIIVAYGSMARIAKGAVVKARNKGKKIGLIRPVSLWPFPDKVFKRLSAAGRPIKLLVAEMSYGQMVEDVHLAFGNTRDVEFIGKSGGGIPSEEEIIKRLARL